ncbi:MAG TPA: hypothetical protein VFV98_15440 [Vicinamibacterales bacterium]|nr:hypothetical protein [Vicinamibacterales bacterium]
MLFRMAGLLGICVIALSPALSAAGGTMTLSPAVVATWFTDQPAGQPVQLRLLVLWRGTPGWFLAGGGDVGGGTDRNGLRYETINYGNVRLTLSFDAAKGVVSIQGKSFDLKGDNVVFVDDVDTAAGPRVASTMLLGPTMPGSAGQLGEMLAPSPLIIEFLRCDAKAPSGRGQSTLDRMCLQNIGIIPKTGLSGEVLRAPQPVVVAGDQLPPPSPSPLPPRRAVAPQTSQPISPTVMATSFTTASPGRPLQLSLLVLWRGTPGWFVEGDGPRGSSGGGSASGMLSQTLKNGGLHLSVMFNEPKRIVTIQDDKPVELKDNNVVFVDEVDAASGPRITGMTRVGPDMPGNGIQLGELLRPSAQIVEFLRCDAKSPTGRGQALLDTVCERMLGIVRKEQR